MIDSSAAHTCDVFSHLFYAFFIRVSVSYRSCYLTDPATNVISSSCMAKGISTSTLRVSMFLSRLPSNIPIDASYGENDLEIEDRDRSTRESTPCSLIRDSSANTPPGLTTRQQSSCTAHRTQMSILRSIPTSDEMEEFFAYAEQRQQRSFIEKYNFDIVKDRPLPGRFEWVQVIP